MTSQNDKVALTKASFPESSNFDPLSSLTVPSGLLRLVNWQDFEDETYLSTSLSLNSIYEVSFRSHSPYGRNPIGNRTYFQLPREKHSLHIAGC
jgi:hypothetical protein